MEMLASSRQAPAGRRGPHFHVSTLKTLKEIREKESKTTKNKTTKTKLNMIIQIFAIPALERQGGAGEGLQSETLPQKPQEKKAHICQIKTHSWLALPGADLFCFVLLLKCLLHSSNSLCDPYMARDLKLKISDAFHHEWKLRLSPEEHLNPFN